MSQSQQSKNDDDKTLLPANLSFLTPHAQLAWGSRADSSLVAWIAWRLFRPVMTFVLFSSLSSLAVGIALWWFTPDWLKAAGGLLPNPAGAVEANALTDWAGGALEHIKTLIEQVSAEPTPAEPPVHQEPPPEATELVANTVA